jgi:hypothetical protein
MADISGLGGESERTCQQMVTAGVRWLQENEGPTVQISESENVTVRIDDRNGLKNELRTYMIESTDGEPTASLLHVSMKHALYADGIGWETYVSRLGNGD